MLTGQTHEFGIPSPKHAPGPGTSAQNASAKSATALSLLIASLFVGVMSATSSAQNYRFVFLAPKSVVLIDTQITSGNWDLRKIRQQYVAGVFKRLDSDGDGTLNAEEAAEIPRQGRFAADVERLESAWALLDTAPMDDQISPAELFTFLDNTLGPQLTIQKAAPRLAETVRLYAELDLDQDDRITAAEFQAGLVRLQLSDFDDDDALSVAELQPYPIAIVQARQAAVAASSTEETQLLLATTESERQTTAERILRVYGSEGELTTSTHLGVPERIFKAFDVDRSGALNTDEVAAYLEKAPPQISLHVSLGPPFVNVERVSPLATDVVLKTPGKRPLFDLGGVPVECVARNRSSDLSDQVGLLLTQAMVLDGDKNGYLDQAEFAQLPARNTQFQDVDLDGNAQVTRAEIDAYFTLDGLAAQSRLVATVSDESKVLFNLLDSNTDNRLTQREIHQAEQILQQYDADGDSALSIRELASRFRITFSQPELLEFRPDAAMNSTSRQGVTRQDSSGPLWFRRMDRNLDNDLSWREFLGTRADFDQIDTDHDGFITLPEAEQAESRRVRK